MGYTENMQYRYTLYVTFKDGRQEKHFSDFIDHMLKYMFSENVKSAAIICNNTGSVMAEKDGK